MKKWLAYLPMALVLGGMFVMALASVVIGFTIHPMIGIGVIGAMMFIAGMFAQG